MYVCGVWLEKKKGNLLLVVLNLIVYDFTPFEILNFIGPSSTLGLVSNESKSAYFSRKGTTLAFNCLVMISIVQTPNYRDSQFHGLKLAFGFQLLVPQLS